LGAFAVAIAHFVFAMAVGFTIPYPRTKMPGNA
jgi:hypothetical protein